MKSNKRSNKIKIYNGIKYGKAWFAFLLLIPALFNFLVFWLYVNYNSIILAFSDKGVFTLSHFKYVFEQFLGSSGGIFVEALRNTLIYWSVGYFVIQTFNVLLAYFFFKKIAGYRFFRAFLYLPNFFAGIVMVTLYKNLIGPEGPLITFLFEKGLIAKRYMLLYTTGTAMPASVAYSLWICVGSVLLWTSGAMARIPKELLESAALDGVTPLQELIYIIIPMISGTLSTLYIIVYSC